MCVCVRVCVCARARVCVCMCMCGLFDVLQCFDIVFGSKLQHENIVRLYGITKSPLGMVSRVHYTIKFKILQSFDIFFLGTGVYTMP